MLKLSGFADEISPDLDQQIAVCRQCDITKIELRGVFGKNVLDFTADDRKKVRDGLRAAGMGVATIGSPIGKVPITDPWEKHFERFKIAVEAAEYFGASMIRVFSYYPPGGAGKGDVLPHRDEVIRRMKAKVDYIEGRPIILVHENERHIYGEKGRECVDLMMSVNSPQFRSAFDFANFVQVGENPLDAWPGLKPFSTHIHIKDATRSDGKVVPAGQGDGQLEPILADAYKGGYRGYLSLEPHLAAHGQFSGFSGPELFITAVDALKALCKKIGIPLASFG
ncbi:MAG: sugar phosphate isomerase/epimerase [Phycisphaerae bacterium]|nr:sugar phosphate isomerase/epimerase [Phycisphaerae bacterium]